MTNTISIKVTPVINFGETDHKGFLGNFLRCLQSDLQINNIVYAMCGGTLVKVRIMAKIQDFYKVKNLNEDFHITNGTLFSADKLFIKVD